VRSVRWDGLAARLVWTTKQSSILTRFLASRTKEVSNASSMGGGGIWIVNSARLETDFETHQGARYVKCGFCCDEVGRVRLSSIFCLKTSAGVLHSRHLRGVA